MTELGEGVAPPPPPAPASVKPPPPPLKIKSETVTTAPTDRGRTNIGVGERVKLAAEDGEGAVSWKITGKSKLNTTAGRTVTLTADERAESATVEATDANGSKASITFTVVQPSGVIMERVPGTNVKHTHGIPSVGMKLNIFIQPDNVSFENIDVSEDDCVAVTTGYFNNVRGIHHAGHGAGNWVKVGPPVAGKGSQVRAQDSAWYGVTPSGPVSVGTFDWPIPWLFRVGSAGSSEEFTKVHQQFTADATGGMTVSKGGANASAALNDPTSSY